MLELDWLALGVAVKYQLPLDNSPQSTLMWKRHQAFSTHRRTLMSERLIKTPIRYYFDNIGIGGLCEGQYCEEAQDGYAAENNIELED